MDRRGQRKVDAMRRVQAAALDLVEAQGYDAVTVEHIAAAAGLGPATVYRHFGSKEQVFLWDDYDPLLLDTLAAYLPDRPLLQAAQDAMVDALAQVYDEDRARILRRARLILEHPTLRAATAANAAQLQRALATLLGATGIVKDDLTAEVLAGALVAALHAAIERWVQDGGREPLQAPLHRALGALARFGPAR